MIHTIQNGIGKLLGMKFDYVHAKRNLGALMGEVADKLGGKAIPFGSGLTDEEVGKIMKEEQQKNAEKLERTDVVSDKEVVGMVVGLQHIDGTIYFHTVGAVDAPRMLGIALVELGGQANNEYRERWVRQSIDRNLLENGY